MIYIIPKGTVGSFSPINSQKFKNIKIPSAMTYSDCIFDTIKSIDETAEFFQYAKENGWSNEFTATIHSLVTKDCLIAFDYAEDLFISGVLLVKRNRVEIKNNS